MALFMPPRNRRHADISLYRGFFSNCRSTCHTEQGKVAVKQTACEGGRLHCIHSLHAHYALHHRVHCILLTPNT